MTTGREALAEAARQETARVYGRLCTERRPPVDEAVRERVDDRPGPVSGPEKAGTRTNAYQVAVIRPTHRKESA